jgi:hypothetical protein
MNARRLYQLGEGRHLAPLPIGTTTVRRRNYVENLHY